MVKITIDISKEAKKQLQEKAKENFVDLSSYICFTLAQSIKNKPEEEENIED